MGNPLNISMAGSLCVCSKQIVAGTKEDEENVLEQKTIT